MNKNKVISIVLIGILLITNSGMVFAEQENPTGFVSDVLQADITQLDGTDADYNVGDDLTVIDTTVAPRDPFNLSQPTQTNVGEILGPSDSDVMKEQAAQQSQKSEEDTQLDNLKKEKEEAENAIEESEAMISFDQELMSQELLELEQISQDISDKQLRIAELELEELELDKKIKSTTKELTKLQDEYNAQDEALKQRLIAMYKTRNTTYLDLLLRSKNLSQFLSSYYYIEKIAKADNELLSSVKEKLDSIKTLSDFLEAARTSLSSNKETIEKTQISLSNMQTIKNNRVIELNEEEAELHKQIEDYRTEIRNIELEIKALAVKTVGERYVGGIMAWPVPGYTRISSPFGYRTHPITGVYKLHTGTDIPAPTGTGFLAANDGIVVKAGYNSAYGNMVIIDHGGGIQTLYAHGSKISVSVGEVVHKGDEVLEVGSTGYATGPHAHFEVRINGSPVEPLDYITSYSSSKSSETVEED